LKGPIARSTLLTTLVFGLRLVLQASTLLLVARLLGPHGYGAFAGAAALAVFLGALAALGMPLMLMRAVAREPEQGRRVLRYALPTVACGGGVIMLAYLLGCAWLFPSAELSLSVLLAVGGAEIIVQPLLLLCAAEWHGRGAVAGAQLLQVSPLMLRLACAVAVMAWAPQSALLAYAIGYLAASVLVFGVAISLAMQPLPRWGEWHWPPRRELGEALGFAATELSRNGPTELDKALAASWLPANAAGLYAVASRMMAAVVLPVMAMVVSALPRLFRDNATTRSGSRRLILWMSGVALSYGTGVGILLWAAAPWLDELLGPEYRGVGAVVRTLCWVVPGLSLRLVFGSILMARGAAWTRVGFEVAGLLTLVLVGAALVPERGPVGLPIALICAEYAMALAGGVMVVRASLSRPFRDRMA